MSNARACARVCVRVRVCNAQLTKVRLIKF